ncbi:MAG: protein-L-isoaspartate(D-aspartate) O-methyltransferase [Desulfobulbaceae bacterium]|jgi:protein-L-isoaspartate(D-aspartate) O-methyltransferase
MKGTGTKQQIRQGTLAREPRPCGGHPLILLLLTALLICGPIPCTTTTCAVAPPAATSAEATDAFRQHRKQMVAGQLRDRDIINEEVLRAMAAVPRHLFVPARLRDQAYIDFPLPIGHGQTISQPYIVAYMTQEIQPKPSHRVLEIGTGSGYQAAILAELVERVYTVEIIPELAKDAGKRLRELGYERVETREGDGYHGWPEAAPFDAIVVTAAAEFIPPPLLEQLKEGGRMIIPVGSPYHVQHLTLVEKEQGRITTRKLLPVRFVPLRRSK